MPVVYKLSRYNWQSSSSGQLLLCGRFIYGGTVLHATDLELLFLQHEPAAWRQILASAGGHFAVILQKPDKIWLITDFVRSYALFYRRQVSEKGEPQLFISDDWQTLTQQELPVFATAAVVKEFEALGYVTGAETLSTEIQQVEAAQLLRIDDTGIVAQRYRIFVRMPDHGLSEPESLCQLDQLMAGLAAQCVTVAAGRQIVLPLSGGYDSRALLLALVRTGYTNLCCFTFGAKNSPEIYLAQQLATTLGVCWYPVFYDAAMWRRCRNDAEFVRYLCFVSNGVAAPNVQVWPALRYLQQKTLIANDALCIPGHTGDFVSGGHLLQDERPVAEVPLAVIAKLIFNRHYQLHRDHTSQASCLLRIETQLQGLLVDLPEDLTVEQLAESWNWQERQSKFIVNSNRYYEFFGLNWWMPFWQNEFVQFWQVQPRLHLARQNLWRRYVDQQCLLVGLPQVQGNAGKAQRYPRWLQQGLNYFFDQNRLMNLIPFHLWVSYRLKLTQRHGTLFSYLGARVLQLFRVKTRLNEN